MLIYCSRLHMQRVADQSAGAVYVKKKCVAGDRDYCRFVKHVLH